MAALEKAKAKQEADGEIESRDPGYLGSHDTYHVGTMKGVGRIYQQTVVAPHARVAIARLDTEKTTITGGGAAERSRQPGSTPSTGPACPPIPTDRGTD